MTSLLQEYCHNFHESIAAADEASMEKYKDRFLNLAFSRYGSSEGLFRHAIQEEDQGNTRLAHLLYRYAFEDSDLKKNSVLYEAYDGYLRLTPCLMDRFLDENPFTEDILLYNQGEEAKRILHYSSLCLQFARIEPLGGVTQSLFPRRAQCLRETLERMELKGGGGYGLALLCRVEPYMSPELARTVGTLWKDSFMRNILPEDVPPEMKTSWMTSCVGVCARPDDSGPRPLSPRLRSRVARGWDYLMGDYLETNKEEAKILEDITAQIIQPDGYIDAVYLQRLNEQRGGARKTQLIAGKGFLDTANDNLKKQTPSP